MDHAELSYGGESISLPIIEGTEQEKALDISKLRAQTGLVTLDPGYVNTGSCESAITFIDGEKGILRHRGFSIEELSAEADFLEVAHLLIEGEQPDQAAYDRFAKEIVSFSMVDRDILELMEAFPRSAHPMSMLLSAVSALPGFYPYDGRRESEVHQAIIRLLAKLPTIAAATHRHRRGFPPLYPDPELGYVANFLYMMFDQPARRFPLDEEIVKALDMLLILHADHEQNCSAATVRMVGSSDVNLYAAIAGGICSLWAPLHGGANQKVMEMLQQIHDDGGDIQKYIDLAKDKSSNFRLMGFGHRVYKNFDPRARIIKKHCDRVLEKLGIDDPLLDLAKQLERAALADDYFVERRLYPNVDFYSGSIYKAIGIPVDMFTVMFALGRLPGWISQWRESKADPKLRIGRPRQIYQGETLRSFESKVETHR
jgi:citrate synthase